MIMIFPIQKYKKKTGNFLEYFYGFDWFAFSLTEYSDFFLLFLNLLKNGLILSDRDLFSLSLSLFFPYPFYSFFFLSSLFIFLPALIFNARESNFFPLIPKTFRLTDWLNVIKYSSIILSCMRVVWVGEQGRSGLCTWNNNNCYQKGSLLFLLISTQAHNWPRRVKCN